jgi:hypothetical protein
MENITKVSDLINKRKRSFSNVVEYSAQFKEISNQNFGINRVSHFSMPNKGIIKNDNTPAKKFQKCIKQKENQFKLNNLQKRVHFALDSFYS